jgi:hypothetical protein
MSIPIIAKMVLIKAQIEVPIMIVFDLVYHSKINQWKAFCLEKIPVGENRLTN